MVWLVAHVTMEDAQKAMGKGQSGQLQKDKGLEVFEGSLTGVDDKKGGGKRVQHPVFSGGLI